MQVHQTPTLLLTRPRAASERFAKGVDGAEVVIAPLMEIVATGAAVDLTDIAGLILTSEAAVAFVPPIPLPAFCVGPQTTAAARAVGLEATMAGPDAEGLIHTLTQARPKGRLLHLHGTHTRGDIAQRLCAAGLSATGIATYDQRACAPTTTFREALERSSLIVPLFSPRSATLFAEAAPHLRSDTQLVALSRAVAAALPAAMRAQTIIAAAPTGQAMGDVMQQMGLNWDSP